MQNKLENFEKTLARLKSFLRDPILTDRDRAGVIQAFEFTFEQCWRSIQKVSTAAGAQVGNAKQAFTFAIQSGWINRAAEEEWIRMIEDRNLTSHTYKIELAEQVLSRIQKTYVAGFDTLLQKLRDEG